MSFRSSMYTEDGVVTIRLVGEVDSRSAPVFNQLVIDAAAQSPRRLVVLVDELAYLSSAGLRCLVFAHQKLGRAVPIVLVGTRPEVAETIRLTGFDRSIVMQETVAP